MKLDKFSRRRTLWTSAAAVLTVCLLGGLALGVPDAGGCGGGSAAVSRSGDDVSTELGANGGPGVQLAPGHTDFKNQCDNFVYINDGAMMLDGKPSPLKSVNFHIDIIAKEPAAGAPPVWDSPRVTINGKQYDLFLVEDLNYAPDGDSWCADAANSPTHPCCTDKDSCEAQLATQVAQLSALGINSVRLMVDHSTIDDTGQSFNLASFGDPWSWGDWAVSMKDPSFMNAILLLEKRAVQFLGARGIRSLMLLTGFPYMSCDSTMNGDYTSYLSQLAQTMANEPYLIGFDFDNEPTWGDGNPAGKSCSINKTQARDLVQSWVNAVRKSGGNSHALTTIGNAYAVTSVDTWDPAYLPIDFNSYHIYPPAPMNWETRGDFVERETFYAALDGCGVACPAGFTNDGANCHDGGGQLWGAYQTSAVVNPPIASHPIYYVQPHGSSCPAGTSYDGANCVVAQGPVNAQAFIWGQGFYYNYLSRSQHCLPPASDDTAHCEIAKVPAGYNPFILQGQDVFFPETHCGNGRKPIIVGEFGMGTSELDPNTGAVTTYADGSAQDQATYLTNVATRAFNCGYQGVQWWEYGDVHWGGPTNRFGLWAPWSQVHPGQAEPSPNSVAERPAGFAMAALDASVGNHCPEPSDFNKPYYMDDAPSASGYSYHGTITDTNDNPIPYALLEGNENGGHNFFLNADASGKWSYSTPRLITQIHATHFGYATSGNHYPVPLIGSHIELQQAAPGDLPVYNPPSSNDQACREVVY